MNRLLFVTTILVALAVPESGRSENAQHGFPVAPTSPRTYWERQLPQPPTPGGPLPNATFRWPFGVLPYYYQPPLQGSSPYTQYLKSYNGWNAPYGITPMPYIPSYAAPPHEEWPYYLSLY